MSDLEKYIASRKGQDSEFADNYEVGYANFRIDSLTPVHLEEPLAVFAELREQIGDAFKGDSVDILRELRE
jgi:hypothetical protein